jgi:N-acetylglucosamine malate deacetylase 1
MKVLVISVHPDDETLGCGGTLLKHASYNDTLYWMIITSSADVVGYDKAFYEQRKQTIKLVAEDYRFKETYLLDFPTTQLHLVDFNELISKISAVIQDVKPDIVYSVNRTDIHTDHQIAAKAVFSCTKSFRNPYIKRILMYECLSETELAPSLPETAFYPNVYSDISNHFDGKLEIMKRYASEIQEQPMPRSIENIKALATFRGSSISVKYAEAFMLLKEIF